MQLTGIHHLTAITANARGNHSFYTQTLGMRLVKKTVNQDDVSAYHLFYADGAGSPGSDITFFDWPARPERRGTHSIARTAFRVAKADSLKYWSNRLAELNVRHGDIVDRSGRAALVDRVVAVAELLRRDELVMAVLRSELALVYIAQRLGRSQQMLIDALADNLRAAQRYGSVRPGDPRRLAAMVLLITQSTIQSAEIVRPILDADALAAELAYSLNGYLS